jgi:hypothetical protein
MPSRSSLLGIALLAAVLCPARAHADPIDFFFGKYNNVSASAPPLAETSGTAVSTFYLRDPDLTRFVPPSVGNVSEIGVTLQFVSSPAGHFFPVTIFNALNNSNDFNVTTVPGTTTFKYSAPETLVELTGPTDLLLVSGLTLPTATDPAFLDFVRDNGNLFVALQGVTLNLPSGAGTPTVTFTNGSSSAPFLVIVPEPASLLSWALGVGGAWLWRKRRRR